MSHITNQIVQNIVQKVAQKITISDALAAFVLRAVVFNPKHEFNHDELSGNEVIRLIDLCSQLILGQSAEIECVKMQVYFETKFQMQTDYLHSDKNMKKNTAAPIIRDIIERKNLKTLSDVDGLFRKIVELVLVMSGMGNINDINVTRQVTLALESVFPHSEVSSFLSLERADKEKQLNGMAQLVNGIRIFNNYTAQENPDKLLNLPELCVKEIREALKLVSETKTVATYHLQRLRWYFENSDSPVAESVNSIIFFCQIQKYLSLIKLALNDSTSNLKVMNLKMAETFQQLQNTCTSRKTVPVSQVYPHFMTLSTTWEGFQDELFLDALRRGIVDCLTEFCMSAIQTIPKSPETGNAVTASEIINSKVESQEVVENFKEKYMVNININPNLQLDDGDADKIIRSAMVMQDIVTQTGLPNCEVLHPGNTAQYLKLSVELNEHCPTTVAKYFGYCVPGDFKLGVLKYKDRLYVFKSLEDAKMFITSPDQYIEQLVAVAKERMALVQLLELKYFPSVKALGGQQLAKNLIKKLVCEVGSQSDTHIVDSYIDPTYQWNEWELRRHALKMVNLRTKKTHGSQTSESHSKRECASQVYLPKNKAAQTTKEASNKIRTFIGCLSLPSFSKPAARK